MSHNEPSCFFSHFLFLLRAGVLRPAVQLTMPFKMSCRLSQVKAACLKCDCTHLFISLCQYVCVCVCVSRFSSHRGWVLTSDTLHSRKPKRDD